MAPDVVLVTGVAGHLGGRLATALAAEPGITRVIGVDDRLPAVGLPGRVELVAADLRGPRVTELLRTAEVDTVVHAAARPVGGGSDARARDLVATMRLLASCQRAEGVRKLVFRSTAEVYGSSPTSQAVFTEQDRAARGRAVELSPGPTRLLSYGRVIDTTRLTPSWSTAAAFDDYLHERMGITGG